ncbi:MAG: anthranilate synthase component II [Gammaproteobacteria bacterium]|nr:MAG: anthranilate synthase component II [Gammaproteobacteria bacterium]
MTDTTDKLKVLMIDNQDSFTFNLVDELKLQECHLTIYQNYVDVDVIEDLYLEGKIDMILISPGPGNPESAGCCLELVERLMGKVVIAGICLGHQVIISSLGGDIGQYASVVHGKSSSISHNQKGLFAELQSPMKVARYHSLSAQQVPEVLEVTAECDGIAMAVSSEKLGLYGLQFHPESILTIHGQQIISNLLVEARKFKPVKSEGLMEKEQV